MLDFVQKRLYLEEKGYLPEEFPSGSEGEKQFRYSPRYKESRGYAQTFFKELPLWKEQKKKSNRKKRT